MNGSEAPFVGPPSWVKLLQRSIVSLRLFGLFQKMKETMISKNVASEIAEKLCDSVAQKLQGKVVGTFSTISSTVRQTLTEACVQVTNC